jgi:hypothetical protein
MSSYPGPIAILPIFNSQEFNYSSSSLTVSTADKRYLRLTGGIESGLVTFNGGLSTNTIYNGTGTFTVPNSGTGTIALTGGVVDLTTNQTIAGQKSFSNIATFSTTNGIPGGQAVTINSLTNPYTTRLYSVNDTYSTDLYYPKFNGIDSLVSTASTATLTNKTTGTLKVGTNGSTFNEVRQGTGTITYSANAQYSQNTTNVTFSPAFSGTPQVYITASNASGGQSTAVILQAGSVSSSGFTAYGLYVFTSAFTGTVNFSWIAFY